MYLRDLVPDRARSHMRFCVLTQPAAAQSAAVSLVAPALVLSDVRADLHLAASPAVPALNVPARASSDAEVWQRGYSQPLDSFRLTLLWLVHAPDA